MNFHPGAAAVASLLVPRCFANITSTPSLAEMNAELIKEGYLAPAEIAATIYSPSEPEYEKMMVVASKPKPSEHPTLHRLHSQLMNIKAKTKCCVLLCKRNGALSRLPTVTYWLSHLSVYRRKVPC